MVSCPTWSKNLGRTLLLTACLHKKRIAYCHEFSNQVFSMFGLDGRLQNLGKFWIRFSWKNVESNLLRLLTFIKDTWKITCKDSVDYILGRQYQFRFCLMDTSNTSKCEWFVIIEWSCTNKYLAHVIEQPNFRILNPKYSKRNFVYLIFCWIKSRADSQQCHL